MRALPLATWRCTRRVFSLDRRPPMTGSTMVRRSGSRRIAPVVNRSRPEPRRRHLNLGKPTLGPLRLPAAEAFQLSSAFTRSAIPDEYASFELSTHHGATSVFWRFLPA